MSLKENSEETLSSTTTTVQNFLNYRPFELDLSDDGSVASEPDHEHSSSWFLKFCIIRLNEKNKIWCKICSFYIIRILLFCYLKI